MSPAEYTYGRRKSDKRRYQELQASWARQGKVGKRPITGIIGEGSGGSLEALRKTILAREAAHVEWVKLQVPEPQPWRYDSTLADAT